MNIFIFCKRISCCLIWNFEYSQDLKSIMSEPDYEIIKRRLYELNNLQSEIFIIPIKIGIQIF